MHNPRRDYYAIVAAILTLAHKTHQTVLMSCIRGVADTPAELASAVVVVVCDSVRIAANLPIVSSSH